MRLAKRTYSLPPDILRRFEGNLGPGERSGVVAKLIEDWLDQRERDRLRQEVIEGCKEMADLYQDIDREWNLAADEVWRDRE